VMAAVAASSLRPWYERPWFTWPPVLRLASASGVLLLLAGLFMLSPLASDGVAALLGRVPARVPMSPAIVDVVAGVERAMFAGRTIWGALIEPLLLYASPVVVVMWVIVATVALALGRVAAERVLQP
jgi:hypothetical protein